MNLGVLSYGVVCPGGFGADALEKKWTLAKASTASGKRSYSVSLSDATLPEFKEWSRAPRMRRSSQISYFLMEAAQQALSKVSKINLSRVGVVASFFLGCVDYSVRFYRQINNDGRRFASPILFPETVFNSPISHVVSTLGLGGPVYSQIGDKASWATAIRTAQCWLVNKTADHVLVIAAEEFDPHEMDAFEAIGWFRKGSMIPSSGSGALLLTAPNSSLVQCAKLTDGNVFFSRKDAPHAARRGLSALASDCPVLSCATSWTQELEQEIIAPNRLLHQPNPGVEAFTVSAAWDTIRAVRHLEGCDGLSEIIVPYWGLTQQFSAAHLSTESVRQRT